MTSTTEFFSSSAFPIVIGIVSGVIIAAVAAWALKRFEDIEAASIVVEKGKGAAKRSASEPALQEACEHVFIPIEAPAAKPEPRSKDLSLVSRQEAIRSRRARVARKSADEVPALDFVPGDVAASVYRQRHVDANDWGRKSSIRVRNDEYWDSSEQISEDRIQESMRQVDGMSDEAHEYVASIVIRGTADDSIVHKRMNLSDPSSTAAALAMATQEKARAQAAAEAKARSRSIANAIATRVAFIDEGLFPEKRTAEDLDRGDDWELALSAMDERIASREPIVVAVPAAIDEEGTDTTGNLMGRKSFENTDEFINYLIGQEFSRNGSDAARSSSKSFLRILKGGAGDGEADGQGKHFIDAQEA